MVRTLSFGIAAALVLLFSSPTQAKVDVPFDGDADGDVLIATADGFLHWVEHNGGNLGGVFSGNNQGAGVTQEIDIADIDGDGDGDILAARNDGFVNWIERNANALGGVASFNVSANHSIDTGDLDGDGDGDFAVVRNDGQVNWLEHNGGNITSNFQTNIGGSNPQAMAVGDLDGDGNGDIVAGQPGGLLTWTERNGNSLTGIFTGFNVSPAVALEIGDMDGDADGDIVIGRADGFLTYAERSGNNITSGIAAPSTNMGSISDLALGDADGDGLDEIIVAQAGNNGFLFVVNQNGSGLSAIASTQVTGANNAITSLDVGDLDGDGLLDVVVGRDDGYIQWLEISADGTSISGGPTFNLGSAVVDLRVASATLIPEPTSLALLAVGLVGLLSRRRCA